MTTTIPEPPRIAPEDTRSRAGARVQASVTVACGMTHTFAVPEFEVGMDGDEGLVAVCVVGLERVGSMTLRGTPIDLNEVVPVETVAAGDLQYTPAPDAAGLDHDSFLFCTHDGSGWSDAVEMVVHAMAPATTPSPEPVAAGSERVAEPAEPVDPPPLALDGAVKTAEGSRYVFSPTDFNFRGPIEDFKLVQIVSTDTCGTLKLHRDAVHVGQVIEVDDIDLELLVYEPADPGKEGFEFRVHDGRQWSDAEYTMVVEVASHYLPPTASDSEVLATIGETRALTAADFRYNDFAGDELVRVRISDVAVAGSLTCGGVPVAAERSIDRADLDAGRLQYTPAAGGGSDSFRFRVHDGTAYSKVSYQMRLRAVPAGAAAGAPRAARPVDCNVRARQDSVFVFDPDVLSPDGGRVDEIEVTAIELRGLLRLDDKSVLTGERIKRPLIEEGRLTFLPMGSGRSKYFEFRVRRGEQWLPLDCSMWIEIQVDDLD